MTSSPLSPIPYRTDLPMTELTEVARLLRENNRRLTVLAEVAEHVARELARLRGEAQPGCGEKEVPEFAAGRVAPIGYRNVITGAFRPSEGDAAADEGTFTVYPVGAADPLHFRSSGASIPPRAASAAAR